MIKVRNVSPSWRQMCRHDFEDRFLIRCHSGELKIERYETKYEKWFRSKHEKEGKSEYK